MSTLAPSSLDSSASSPKPSHPSDSLKFPVKGKDATTSHFVHESTKVARKGIGRSNLHKLARRAGVKRISEDATKAVRQAGIEFIKKVTQSSMAFTETAGRVTLSLNDVLQGLRRMDRQLYGYGV